MANYTSQVRTLSGRPGSTIDSLGDVTIVLTADEGYRFDDPHGFSVIDTQDIFDEETIVRVSDRELRVVVSVRDDIAIPNMDTDVPIRITGETIRDTHSVDVVISIGDDPIDTDSDGTDDSEVELEDDLDFPVDSIPVDIEGEEGDMMDVGNALLCPLEFRRFTEDANGNIILPNLPRNRNLGNGSMLVYSYYMTEDGMIDRERTIDRRGCVRYRMQVVIGNADSDGTMGGGMGGDLSNGGGNGGGDDDGTFDDIFNIGPDGMMNDTGGGSPDPPMGDPDGNNEIFNIEVDADNLHPVRGGFITVTATGTEGATGSITLTPRAVGGEGAVLPPTVRPITVNLTIPASGVDRRVIRIPSLAGDENLNPLCMPDLPDNVDGAEWDINSPDDIPLNVDTIMQDTGSQVCFQVNSADGTIPTDANSRVVDMGWRHSTVLEGVRGSTYPAGIWSVTIPPGAGQWNLIGATDGVVDIDPAADITCDAGFDPGFCDGTARVDADGNLVITQPYNNGSFGNNKRTCSLSLDNLADRSAEIRITWTIPDTAPFSVATNSQSEFSYAGEAGAAVVAGAEPTQIILTANTGHTWRHIDPSAMVSLMAAATNSANDHVTNIRTIPTISSLQDTGAPISELIVLWDLQGNYRTTGPTDTYTMSLINGVPRRVVTNTFNVGGTEGRGADGALVNARFVPQPEPVTGVETQTWTRNYVVRADDGFVFRRNLPIRTTASSTHPVTVSTPQFVGSDPFPNEFGGTLSAVFGDVDDVVNLNAVASTVRQVRAEFSKVNNIAGSTARTGFVGTLDTVEGSIITRQLFIDATDSMGTGFTQLPNIEVPGTATASQPSFSGTPVIVDGVSYYPSVSVTISKTITAEPVQSIAVICTGGRIDAIPATFTRMVVESSSGIIPIPDVVAVISDTDADRRIDDETINISFSVRTENGFAWSADALTNGDFTVTHGANISNVNSTFNQTPNGDVTMNEAIFINVTATYTVPAGTGGGASLTETLTITGNGPTGLATITATPTSLTFPADSNRDEGRQDITVVLSNGSAPTDTITHTTPTGFTVTVPSDVTEGTRIYRVRPTNANTSLTDSITGTITFGSTLVPTETVDVSLTQSPAALTLSVDDQVTVGSAAGSTATFTITTNGLYTISGIGSDFTVSPSLGPAGTHTITVTAVNENTNIADITDTITVGASVGGVVTLTEDVIIAQSGATRTITLDGDNAGSDGTQTVDPIGNVGGTGMLSITSNDPSLTWTAEEVTDADEIVSGLRTSGGANDPVTYMVAANGMGEPAKTATIRIVFRSGGAVVSTRTVTIQLAVGEPNPTQAELRTMFPGNLWLTVGGQNTFSQTDLRSLDGQMVAGNTGQTYFGTDAIGTTFVVPPDVPASWTMRRLVETPTVELSGFPGSSTQLRAFAAAAPLQRGAITPSVSNGVNFQVGGSDAAGDYQLGGRDVSSALYGETFTGGVWNPPSHRTSITFESSLSDTSMIRTINIGIDPRVVTPGTVNSVTALRGTGLTIGADLPSGTHSTHRGLGTPTYSEMVDGNNVQFPFGVDPILFRVDATDHWAMEIDSAVNIDVIVADQLPVTNVGGNFFLNATPNGDWTSGIQLTGTYIRYIFHGTRTFAVLRNSVRAGARTPSIRIRPVTGSTGGAGAGLGTSIVTVGGAFRTYNFRGPRGL